MPLLKHPTALQMSIEKHAKTAFEKTGLLLQALIQEDSDHSESLYNESLYNAQVAYILLKKVMQQRGLSKSVPKPTSAKT